MNSKLICPVCNYQEVEGNICPNCDADLSLIRMLQELPPVENLRPTIKVTGWQLGAALLLLVIGIGLGSLGSFIFVQSAVTVVAPHPIAVNSDRPTPPINDTAILVPQKPPEPITYTVKPGDHLSAITEKFCGEGISWQVVVNANPQLKGRENLIKVGEVFKIPNCQEGT
ncbi:LysM peptidoglycan-binding domain-containing protein [Nodularia sphaerocarpa]|uniref:LysM peptidoglycan-binding domain-containing protein n=1 Tax=Nodularia sphaerocarpa TaxID=137816 RepID=UPI001EFC05D5|nr:LysM peptidoglycan-binding domain-containing protein [Nodularia sphaerocarpa]MDB9372012.1 LysM peptidoglycan-binding domain-containing protein [Nodularia sphaerocarpa CS-585]MDB9379484.1 LysM peptidoglycan-binding domain-containing protein [Nodularia sphaerocarpa CS-585A2]ULP73573.1 hypothetical protein BDGGKGIB_03230 [Nodularia sphaerocarpa UHCC 0038]